MIHYLRWRRDMVLHWRAVARLLPRGGRIVEVGTWRGASARRWLRRRPTRLVCVDAYQCPGDESWEGRAQQRELDAMHEAVLHRFSRFEAFTLVRQRSPGAARAFQDAAYDVAYIDGDHSYEGCRADLSHWWPKVRPGGWLVLDDHLTGRWWGSGVIEAAEDFKPRDEARRVSRGRWLCIQKSS